MKFILPVIFLLTLSSCELFRPSPQVASVPMIYFDFKGDCKSKGIEDFKTFGNQNLSYIPGIKDSCLNLSITSPYRKPVIIRTKGDVMLDQQPYLAVIVWVKMAKNDLETYGIIGNKSIDVENEKGWIISSTLEGSWQLDICDGIQSWNYKATPSRQRINDNRWHQIGFSIDKTTNMAKTYFDGKMMGIINLDNLSSFEADYHLHIGCNPGSTDYSMDTFNGMIDETGIWVKNLSEEEFRDSYLYFKNEKLPEQEYAEEEFKVLTWNIWNGGRQLGRTAGVQQIVNVIKSSGADIISLQEDFGSGEFISDQLNYHFYRCSNNLSLLSRFPIKNTHHIYKPLNSGNAEIMITPEESVMFCPIWLSHNPNIKGLLVNTSANTDTILDIEKNSRGNEIKFILSELKKFNSIQNTKAIILAGDYNSGSHVDWTEDNINNKYNKAIPFPTSILMEENQFIDAYRKIYPDIYTNLGNTYSPLFREGYNDRIDYVYYKGNSIEAINASVIDSTSSFFPSDHAALLVTFKRTKN
ncbi:endonuclease/exonuclease/phosphatase family protein [Plebeiibacterium sediminum]|uniref:Endonuclease/exonuclease/phosphatase family protein n=1 Tax=Plebeiibacterium sediminum TaxID=2992112 RepID=A0AAE3M675_9BACT|nr:endonuclease/exonuclease/phosphatase family protein [Plebeiobacterium sediminum]MCW3787701.1 endonuclease/exonuclease/phosphatase family protein [Plebeiobacterium sediminum]